MARRAMFPKKLRKKPRGEKAVVAISPVSAYRAVKGGKRVVRLTVCHPVGTARHDLVPPTYAKENHMRNIVKKRLVAISRRLPISLNRRLWRGSPQGIVIGRFVR